MIDPGPGRSAAPARRWRRRVGGRAGGGGAGDPRAPRSQRRGAGVRGAVGAPVLAHGDPAGARSPAMARLAAAGGLGGGEGIDARLPAGPARSARARWWRGPGWTLTALATPGHTADHLSFAWAEGGRALLRRPGDGLGDDADLAARRRPRRPSGPAWRGCRRAARRSTIPATARRCAIRRRCSTMCWRTARGARRRSWRRWRGGPATVAELVAAIYAGVDPALHGAAGRNVLAHLIDLAERGLAVADGPPAGRSGAWPDTNGSLERRLHRSARAPAGACEAEQPPDVGRRRNPRRGRPCRGRTRNASPGRPRPD